MLPEPTSIKYNSGIRDYLNKVFSPAALAHRLRHLNLHRLAAHVIGRVRDNAIVRGRAGERVLFAVVARYRSRRQ